MAGGTVTATWSGSYPRTPTAYVAGPPPLSPLAVAVANTPGQWLFAIVSWRQDAGTEGLLQYPSTVTVSDDVKNFWIPVKTVPVASTAIVRCAVWMAPAARAAEFVFVSPTAYQSALTVLIAEVTADCPWYSVAAVASNFTYQGTSISASVPANSGLFSIGVIARDSLLGTDAGSTSGWSSITSLPAVFASNGSDHSGDLQQFAWYAVAGAGTNTIGDTVTGGASDLGEVIITVHGVTDVIDFPYVAPDAEGWPVLVTEIAAGPVLNANPAIISGSADWTGNNATVASVTWPVYQPWPNYQALITPSLSVTPSGSSGFSGVGSELEPVSVTVQYGVLAYAYSPAGYASGLNYAGIAWYDVTRTFISTTQGTNVSFPAGGWTQLTLASPVFPPQNAAYGAAVIIETAATGDVPSSAVFYVGYAGFGPADAYEDIPADEIAWSDVSTRNFTQDDIKISRGIQYQQQSLEAGTMTVYLRNDDGAMMFGNILSSYWPTTGDTDVPIRLRAIWQQSITPYYPLFSGFTDEIEFGWAEDDGTWYGYGEFEASDAWSRLTSQLLGAAEQEILEDNPVSYSPLNLSGTNLAVGNNTPFVTTASAVGTGGATATFGSSAISLPGDPGVSCWASSGATSIGFQGVALTYFPPQPLSVAAGLTVEFWMSPTVVSASQPATVLTVCTAWSRKGPMWTISINNSSGAGSSTASVTVYDKTTGAGTTTSIGTWLFLGASNAVLAYQFAVSATENSLTVNVLGLESVTVSCNLGPVAAGLSFGGNAGPVYGLNSGSTLGFMNLAVADAAIFTPLVPPARIAAHHQTALTGYPSELDTSRLARVTGYAGATPAVLAMRCLDLAIPPAADVDPVTSVTDTNGQVVSAYFTNIASSTFAFMFVNGAGVLVYRRRLEAYDRASPQWVLGEDAPYPLNFNTLGEGLGTAGWSTGNGATLAAGSIANGGNAGPYFQLAGVFHGNGSTSGPYILWTSGPAVSPVTPGDYYSFSALIYSPQGWATGVTGSIQFYNSASVQVSSLTTAVTPLGTGSLLYLTTGPVQAPATAAFVAGGVQASGTPASTVQFYVTEAVFAQVPAVTAGGQTPQTATAGNSVTSPAAGQQIAVVPLPADVVGPVIIEWGVTLGGTVSTPEVNNFKLVALNSGLPFGGFLAASVNAGSAGNYGQTTISQVLPPGTTGIQLAAGSNSPTTGSVYSGVITLIYQAGGPGAAPETPYLPSAKLSSDRALLFNQAILTQYGTDTQTTYRGTSLVFAPTSGVVVLIQNSASVTARAGVPYTATIYINNTAQALPYMLNEPSMEDVGNWVTQTLAAPLLRPETVTITPIATPQATLMALGAEIGDTTTMRRRPQTGGAPEIQILTYVSKLTHTINMSKEVPWTTEYELSPFAQGQVLACDDVIHGTNTGGNLFGF